MPNAQGNARGLGQIDTGRSKIKCAIVITVGRKASGAVDHLPADQCGIGVVSGNQEISAMANCVADIDLILQHPCICSENHRGSGAGTSTDDRHGGVLHHHPLAVHPHKTGIVVRANRRQLVSAQLLAQHPAHELLALVASGVVTAVDPSVDISPDLLEDHPLAQQRVGTVSPQFAVEINGGGLAITARGAKATLGPLHGLIAEHNQAQ